jgi:quercetin dioxygenase-like cupin family protein
MARHHRRRNRRTGRAQRQRRRHPIQGDYADTARRRHLQRAGQGRHPQHQGQVQGTVRLIVVDLVIAPGGTTGWHSHPGPALVIIKVGTFTLYDGDDRRCRPHRYGPGQAFVDEGGGHVHIGRNETGLPVKLLVTFIVPKGAAPTIDAPAPGNCRF